MEITANLNTGGRDLIDEVNPNAATFIKHVSNPIKYKFFLLWKLPMAFIAGLRVEEVSAHRCRISMPYGWRTQNPFKSIYFAAQSMAAEMSTGLIAYSAVFRSDPQVSMIVTGLSAEFTKMAKSRTTFTCEMGEDIYDTVQRAKETGKGERITVKTVGHDKDGNEVARFSFEWSFKVKKKK